MAVSELTILFVSPGEVMAAGILIPTIGAMVVGMRFRVRFNQKSTTGADDYTILLALVSHYGIFVSQTIANRVQYTDIGDWNGYLPNLWYSLLLLLRSILIVLIFQERRVRL